MKKKSIVVTLALALTLTALTGCGDKNETVVDKNKDIVQEVSDTVETKTEETEVKKDDISSYYDRKADIKEQLEKLGSEDDEFNEWVAQNAYDCGFKVVTNVESVQLSNGECVRIATYENGVRYIVHKPENTLTITPIRDDDIYWNEDTKYVDYENRHYGNECEYTFEDIASIAGTEIKDINKTVQIENGTSLGNMAGTILLYRAAITNLVTNDINNYGIIDNTGNVNIPSDSTITILRSVTGPVVPSDETSGSTTYYEIMYDDTVCYWNGWGGFEYLLNE